MHPVWGHVLRAAPGKGVCVSCGTGGLKNLRWKVQRGGPDSAQLPTAHTCFNTLILPQYASLHKLRSLLSLAVENAEGFGLQ